MSSRELMNEVPSQHQRVEVPVIATKDDLRVLAFQIEVAARKIKDFESKIEGLGSKWDEFIATAKLRFDRIQGHFQRQGESSQGSFRDVHTKIATIASKVNERKMTDVAIHEMVDRQGQVIQSLEARLQQMQKLINEQEIQMMQMRGELQDALKEVIRLKRV